MRAAREGAESARLRAQITGGEAQPAVGGVVVRGKMGAQQGVKSSGALRKLGGNGQDKKLLAGQQGLGLNTLRALVDESAKHRLRCGGQGSDWEQVRQDAAIEHLFKNHFRGQGDGYRDCLALADFVFEDAEGFIERGNQEIDDAVAHGLAEGCRVGGCGESCGPGDVCRTDEAGTVLVQLAGIEEFAAEAGFGVDERRQGGVKAVDRGEFLLDGGSCSADVGIGCHECLWGDWELSQVRESPDLGHTEFV